MDGSRVGFTVVRAAGGAYPHQPQKKRGVKPRVRDSRAYHSPRGFQYLAPRDKRGRG